jgi:hypothetical protein
VLEGLVGELADHDFWMNDWGHLAEASSSSFVEA